MSKINHKMTQPDIGEVACLEDMFTTSEKCLTDEERERLQEQDKRKISDFKAQQLELQAQRNWDLFYKRNETRFFKDRRWTTREFKELLVDASNKEDEKLKILEVGCGVGNFIFPLIEDQGQNKFFYYACDFSPRAIEFVRSNLLYDEKRIHAFQCDITTAQLCTYIPAASLDIVSMIFVLSAIHPDKFSTVIKNVWHVLKPGGIVLFRDYGLYDMAQLRFRPGHKIAENFYMRQDGTRSYYFCKNTLAQLFTGNGYNVICNAYVHRRTLNVKKGIDVPRIFVQGKFQKQL